MLTEYRLARALAVIVAAIIILADNTTAQICENNSSGLPPINDLGSGYWHGAQGGLYPGGQNIRPPEHNQDGIDLASQVIPLDQPGNPDPVNGKIVFLSVGMSNTQQEFARFELELESVQNRNPFLITINGAQGGWAIDDILRPNSPYWNHITDLLFQEDLIGAQVQVIWFKEADFHPASTAGDTSFVGYVDSLKEKFKTAINITKSKFQNSRICYLAGRIYGGYDETLANPEPFAFYNGWAAKYLIEDQINGDTSLVYLGPNAKAPWLSWGAYLWADGINPRSDGLTWICPDDFEPDGRHPSELGEQKVAALLLSTLMDDETAIPWLLDGTTDATPGSGGNLPTRFSITNYPNPFNPLTTFRFTIVDRQSTLLSIYDMLGQEVARLVNEELSPGTYTREWNASAFPTGVYYSRLRSGDFVKTNKLVLLK